MSVHTPSSEGARGAVSGWRGILLCTLLMSLAMLAGMAVARFAVIPSPWLWLVPGGLLVGGGLLALGLAWRRGDTRRVVGAIQEASGTDGPGAAEPADAAFAQAEEDAPGGLSATGFQQMVAEAFRRRGYRVVVRKGGPDINASADIILEGGGRRYFVQCGLWKTARVGVTAVRKLHAHVQAAGVDGGYIVTTGGFTGEARELARESGIEPVDGERLRHLMRGGHH